MFDERQLEPVFELLSRVAEAVAAVAGPTCEVTLYDLRLPEHSIVTHCGRQGLTSDGSVPAHSSPPDMFIPASGRDFTVNRVESPWGGDELVATVWIRDFTGHPVGALTVRSDYSDLLSARSLLQRLLPREFDSEFDQEPASISESPEVNITRLVRNAVLEHRKPLHAFGRDDRVNIIRSLDQAGAFSMRRSADVIARELAISRASVYSYLREVRSDAVTTSVG